MSEENKQTENRQEVDLSQLTNIEFATAWTPSSSVKKDFGDNQRGSFRRQDKDKKRDFGERKFDKPRKKFNSDKPRGNDKKFRKQGKNDR